MSRHISCLLLVLGLGLASLSRADVIFTRSTSTGEGWVLRTATFTPSYSGNYTLGFNVTAGGPSGDNSILIDAVRVTNGATTLFADGFETPNLSSNTGTGSAVGSTTTIGAWACTNSSGILDGSPPNWGLAGQGLGSADGTTQYAFLQAGAGTLPNIKATSTLPLVVGQTYTVSFYQASRRDFGGTTTYTLTLDAPAPVVFASGISAVTAWEPLFLSGPVVPDSNESKPVPTISYNDPRWTNAHTAFVFPLGSHPWEGIVPYNFSANWINAWAGNGQLNRNPGLESNRHGLTSSSSGWAGYPNYGIPYQSFTKYSTTVFGEGEYVLQFLADNASWIYVDGTLVGYQDYNWSVNGTGRFLITLTGAGAHDLGFVIWDGGGLAGGKFRLETRASFETNNPGVPLPPRAATVTLSNLTRSYDGTPKAATVTTAPGGLTTSVTYNGSATAPTNVGSYAVVATVTTAGYLGSATGTLTIDKGAATVTLGSLAQTYDGSVKSATATTSPAGLPVVFTYTGASVPPVNAGNYTAFGVIDHANYRGSASGTLVIATAPVAITLGSLAQNHDGSPKSVTTATSPTGVALAVTYDGSTTAPSAVGSYAVVAQSANANYTGSTTGTLVISDVTPPVLTLPASQTLEATGPAGAVATFSASATDLVSGVLPVTFAPASGSTFPLGATTVTATAVDAAGNPANGSFTITVRDTTPAVLTLPANQTIEATGPNGAVANFTASATDLVDGAVAVTLTPASGSTFALGTTTVTATATDAAGNPVTGSFTVTVHDTTAPVIAAPANLIIEATSPAGAVVTFAASATDLVDGAVAVSSSVASGSVFPLGTTAVTLTATDAAGNPATAVFTVTVSDTTSPVIAPQDNLVVEATGADGAVVSFTPSALDIVSGAVSVTSAPASGSTFPLGTTTVTLTATDAAGNPMSSTFTVTVQDTTAPAIATPAAITAEATSAAGAVVTFAATASDLVDGAVSVSASPASGSVFPLGTSVVTLTSTDAHGNPATSTFNVTVVDTTAPVIAVPADLVVEATSGLGAVATFTTTASDLVDGSAPVSFSPASDSTFALGTTTVTITSTDAAGNVATPQTFTVTVVDTTAPTITVPAVITAEATSASGAAVSFAASAADLVDSTSTVSYSPEPGSTFALGTSTVTVTSTDSVGNTGTETIMITVVDTTAPVITVPANLTVEATSAAGAAATFSASATDAVGATVAYSAAPGSTFAIGTTTVTVTSTDAAGNVAAPQTFTVTVVDTIAPVLTAPANQIAEATSAAGAAVDFAASASDAVGATITYSHAPGSVFPIGTTSVLATAADAAGQVVSTSFAVTVQDTTAPALTLPDNIVAEAGSHDGARVTFSVSAFDLVGGVRAVTVSRPSGSVFPLGVTTVTATATDTFGNTATGTFTVTVRDTTAPTLRLPANLTVKAKSAAGAKVYFVAWASDLVDRRVKIAYSVAPGSVFALGTTTVTVTATDDSGNVATGTFTVTVVDRTKPEFIKLSVNPSRLIGGNHQMVPVTVTAIAKDAIDPAVDVRIVSVTSDEPISGTGSGDLSPDWQITGALTLNLRNEYDPRGNGRIYTIAVTATDDSGNTRTRTLHVMATKKSGVRFEDCDNERRSERQRCEDDDNTWHSRDHGDDDDND